MDLVFPHHEAEIAQSNACNDCDPAKYWMHNNMITINGQKMGKSLGNFINLDQFFSGNHKLLEREYPAMTVRFFILQAQYRSQLDFSNDALMAAEKGLQKLMAAKNILQELKPNNNSDYDVKELKQNCYNAMNDDFNTPILIAHLFDGVKIINSCKAQKVNLTQNDINELKNIFDVFVSNILGLTSDENTSDDLTDEVMKIVLQLRSKAKTEKDWNTADLIRDELNKINIEVKDSPDGSSWTIK